MIRHIMALLGKPRRLLDAAVASVTRRVRLPLAEGDLERAALVAAGAADHARARALELGSGLPPACDAGCSSCCHVHVEVSLPELEAIARHLERTLPAVDLAAFLERLSVKVAQVDPLSDDERWAARIPC